MHPMPEFFKALIREGNAAKASSLRNQARLYRRAGDETKAMLMEARAYELEREQHG